MCRGSVSGGFGGLSVGVCQESKCGWVCVGGVLAGVLEKIGLCLYSGLEWRDDCVDAYVAV